MAEISKSSVPRSVVEHMVREALYRELNLSLPSQAQAPNALVVNVSARHCHLSQETVETLFGKGHQLTPVKWLYQDGYFAAEETVTLVGPRSRVISNLRILGPCRADNQVELAYTDAIALGFDIPVRISGNIQGSTGGMLMGPEGFYEMEQGIIRAKPHVHMNPDEATYFGVEDGEDMRLKVGGNLPMTFDNVEVRVGKGIKLEVHIDTDEGNACHLGPDTPCELVKK